MATTRLIDIKVTDKRATADIVKRSLHYDWNFKKTRNCELITAINCEKESAITEFLLCQKEYEMKTGKAVDQYENSNVIYKIRQSFAIGEVDADTAHEIGVKLANSFLKGNYQCTVSTHIDKAHIHNHITFNAVGLDFKKYNMKKYDWKILRDKSDKLCNEYGLSVVIPSKERRSQTYSKSKPTSFRQQLKADIDSSLKTTTSYDEFIKLLSEDYFVDTSHKYLTFRHKTNGQQRNIRLDSLGESYESEKLKNSFLVQKNAFEKIKLTISQTVKAKGKKLLADSDSSSYSQKLRNINLIFKTVGILNEYGINQYKDFENKANSVSLLITQNEVKLHNAQKELSHLKSILKSVEIMEQYKPIISAYQLSLLPERFYSTHKDELEIYNLANEHLQSCSVDCNSLDKHHFLNQISEFETTLENLLSGSKILNENLSKLETAKNVIDEMHTRKDVQNKKIKMKEGKNHVR